MRYENIYSSFPCPVSGHFSAASRRVAPIRGSVWCLLPNSSLCQNGKQVEIITKMIFELCYIEAIAFIITTIETTIDCIVTIVSIVVYIVLLYNSVVLK